MTTSDKADEAGLEAAAHRPSGPALRPTGPQVGLKAVEQQPKAGPLAAQADPPTSWAAAQADPDHVEVLAHDAQAAKILAKAEAQRLKVLANQTAQDRKADRKLRVTAAQHGSQAAQDDRKHAKAAARSAQWAARGGLVAAKAAQVLAGIRSEAAASWSGFIYLVAATVAVGSQYVFFHRLIEEFDDLELLRSTAGPASLLAALFIEGFGLAFYSTSVASRLRSRSGWVPRLCAWALTGFAAVLQYNAHKNLMVNGFALVSWACAGASLGAMLLAEVRTTYQVAEELEKKDQKDKPLTRIGVKFWLRYRRQAWWAWSAQIANPAIRTRTAALQAGQDLAQRQAKADLNRTLMAAAQRSLRAAQRQKGASEAILVRLNELAFLGLEALELQAQLASVASAPLEAAAQPDPGDEAAAKAAAKASKVRGEAGPAPAQPKPAAGEAGPGPAQPDEADPEVEVKAEQPKPSFADWAKASGWAGRPGGLADWTQRIAFLASVYPKPEGSADGVPPRSEVLEEMKLRVMDPERANPKHSWTNKQHVGWALSDLKSLRSEGYFDPILDPEPVVTENLSSSPSS